MPEKTVPAKIIDAIKAEDGDVIRSLFEENPDQIEFYTPFSAQTWLGYAAQIGNIESIKTLIDIGLDINTGDKREDVKPICSASHEHYNTVKFLLEKGAVLDVSLSVRNPLFAAIVGRSPEIVKLLLEAGIDSKIIYNSNTMKGMDAGAFALMRGETELAKILATWNTDGSEEAISKYIQNADKVAELNAK
jgi:ankyrin repeat protein